MQLQNTVVGNIRLTNLLSKGGYAKVYKGTQP